MAEQTRPCDASKNRSRDRKGAVAISAIRLIWYRHDGAMKLSLQTEKRASQRTRPDLCWHPWGRVIARPLQSHFDKLMWFNELCHLTFSLSTWAKFDVGQ